jgi:hypothetical protein
MAAMTDEAAVTLVPGRECGDCTACCKIPAIETRELQKPRGVMCPHNTGPACGIYHSRPQPCRTFFCLWRQVPTMPDAIRPDRIGVMFTIERSKTPGNPFEQNYVIGRAINGRADFDNPMAKMTLDVFVKNGDLPVWLSADGERNLFHPYPALRDAILNPQTAPQALLGEVQLWRKRLGLGTN